MQMICKTAMGTAILFRPLPECSACSVQTVPEVIAETDYRSSFRVVCPACGRASGVHGFDSYECTLPALWNVIETASAEFCGEYPDGIVQKETPA